MRFLNSNRARRGIFFAVCLAALIAAYDIYDHHRHPVFWGLRYLIRFPHERHFDNTQERAIERLRQDGYSVELKTIIHCETNENFRPVMSDFKVMEFIKFYGLRSISQVQGPPRFMGLTTSVWKEVSYVMSRNDIKDTKFPVSSNMAMAVSGNVLILSDAPRWGRTDTFAVGTVDLLTGQSRYEHFACSDSRNLFFQIEVDREEIAKIFKYGDASESLLAFDLRQISTNWNRALRDWRTFGPPSELSGGGKWYQLEASTLISWAWVIARDWTIRTYNNVIEMVKKATTPRVSTARPEDIRMAALDEKLLVTNIVLRTFEFVAFVVVGIFAILPFVPAIRRRTTRRDRIVYCWCFSLLIFVFSISFIISITR